MCFQLRKYDEVETCLENSALILEDFIRYEEDE